MLLYVRQGYKTSTQKKLFLHPMNTSLLFSAQFSTLLFWVFPQDTFQIQTVEL